MITKSALDHNGKLIDCYGYDENTLQIRLRLAKNEAKSVHLRIGDPYHWERGGGGGNLNAEGAWGWVGGTTIPMQKEVETAEHEYWIANFMNESKRFRYAFVIEGINERIIFGEKRIVTLTEDNEEASLQDMGNFFCMPYLNKIDLAKAPTWVKSTIWYQIFPDRFANGNPAISPENVMPWGSKPEYANFMGGDLEGVISKLDYLQDLGINGLYFCPIFKAPSNHKYDTIDYMEIDPHFGDKTTFKRLVEEAHARGIRVMLDAVINHAGSKSPFFQDVIDHQEQSQYKEWFHIKEFPVSLEKKNFETFAFSAGMPKFNTENEACREYLLNMLTYWIQEFDIDGWRLDVANEVDHSFWREFRKRAKAIKSDVYILGEIWHDAKPWLRGDQFDAVMDYPIHDAICDFACRNRFDAEHFKYAINEALIRYPRNINEVTFALLDSHDTERIVYRAKGNLDLTRLCYILLFSYTGSLSLYYGAEIGLDGGADPDCRRAMPWDEVDKPSKFNQFMRKLIQLRKSVHALRSAEFEWIKADQSPVVIYRKKSVEGNVLIMMNTSAIEQTTINKCNGKKLSDLFTGKAVRLKGDKITLKPYEYFVLQEGN